jgi:hypothetical protein
MPRGIPKDKSPGIAAGSAVQPANAPAREQIVNMIAPGSEEDFAASLPESTAAPLDLGTGTVEAPQKRKRRSKEEMAAARGGAPATPPPQDDLMSDPRYRKIMGKMSGLGGKKIVAIGFKASGKPLNDEEEEDVDDCFYALSRKGGLAAGDSWAVLIIYTLVIIVQLALERTDIPAKLKELFERVEPVKPPQPKVEAEAPAGVEGE